MNNEHDSIHDNEHYEADQDAVAKDPTALGAYRTENETDGIAPAQEKKDKTLRTMTIDEHMKDDQQQEIGESELNTGTAFDTAIGDPTILGPRGDE